MGGHGGLNILPQKRWNVYNYENREKVRRDEEAAAREEQLKREQSRKRDAELRLEKLRQTRGIPIRESEKSDEKPSSVSAETESVDEPPKPCDSNHINLFEGIRIFDPIKAGDGKREKRVGKFGNDNNSNKKVKKEEVRTVGPEEEKYRLGYGIVGKGSKLPWYMEKRVLEENTGDEDEEEEYNDVKSKEKKRSVGKKSLQELREERLKRERSEKERERALLMTMSKKNGGFSSRRR
ncbi:uncharacterized protein LOC127240330 [Andrographis paniculata]|uniref:uncharacterized protein LOC127240330 n=1 Tax=Andrographis paniculata TaxID=175694 RepID=UPI0021E86191|nr:uncharacterized protein LOC127240330 [Andrographis paniculata]XP_051114899.1 uncharacterized protein LOC127240330 [Andrographis paniculata]XP_051114900.1 uncharacterized protein LOC127240330 [Andrographis paniculata]XP_051114901.1 uncharacterized protein LOC127240330 [Andrographis paniculata]XP_051114902.1 uncharacterized protein LOC127240330 [Andrographis paniculata]XP_051114903.1 uncharacterized protein LOC127240330 [Andrographis paniculata]XP_051114904.1 uncharacterized protein LOC12724